MTIGLTQYLILSAVLFSIGLFGALSRRNAIVILMCVELMLNAANLALISLSRFVTPVDLSGQTVAIFQHRSGGRRGDGGAGHHHRAVQAA